MGRGRAEAEKKAVEGAVGVAELRVASRSRENRRLASRWEGAVARKVLGSIEIAPYA